MKNSLLIVFYLTISVNTFCQQNNQRGIFDMPNKVSAISQVWFAEAEEPGESSYETEQMPNGNWKIVHRIHKPTFPNPLSFSYSFGMAKTNKDSVAMDIQAVMPPSALYLDTNALQLSYIGDKIILPNKPGTSTQLLNVNGLCVLRKKVDNGVLISYEISLTNRKFLKTESITLNGKIYEAYKHTYDYEQKTFSKTNIIIAEVKEAVEEIYVVGYGLVNQTRNNLVASARLEGTNKVRSKTIISTLFKLL